MGSKKGKRMGILVKLGFKRLTYSQTIGKNLFLSLNLQESFI